MKIEVKCFVAASGMLDIRHYYYVANVSFVYMRTKIIIAMFTLRKYSVLNYFYHTFIFEIALKFLIDFKETYLGFSSDVNFKNKLL